jgi:hypothetical protein
MDSSNTLDTVVDRIDAQIGHPDGVTLRKNLSEVRDEVEMEKNVAPVTQPNGIMEFARFDLGEIYPKREQG